MQLEQVEPVETTVKAKRPSRVALYIVLVVVIGATSVAVIAARSGSTTKGLGVRAASSPDSGAAAPAAGSGATQVAPGVAATTLPAGVSLVKNESHFSAPGVTVSDFSNADDTVHISLVVQKDALASKTLGLYQAQPGAAAVTIGSGKSGYSEPVDDTWSRIAWLETPDVVVTVTARGVAQSALTSFANGLTIQEAGLA